MKSYDNIIYIKNLRTKKNVFAANGLPNPNSSMEGEVGFFQSPRPADGVFSSSVLNRGLKTIRFMVYKHSTFIILISKCITTNKKGITTLHKNVCYTFLHVHIDNFRKLLHFKHINKRIVKQSKNG